MSGKSLEELIDGEVEGTNTPLETSRLLERAAREPAVAERLEDHRRAAAALHDASRVEAPPGLAGAVMEKVRTEGQLSPASSVLVENTASHGYWAGRHGRGGTSMATSRKVLVGIAAAAVIAIGYFAVNGFPPVGPGAEGTVGAAKRYQSEQMNASDVAVQNDGVQALLQSDDFRRVVSNKETREILTSKEFQRAVSDASVQAVLHQLASDKSFADSLRLAASDAAAQKLFADAARSGAADAARSGAADAARSGAADAARSGAADAARSGLLSLASQNQALGQLARSEAFQKALQNGSFAGLLANQSFVNLISNPAAAGLVSSGAFQQAISSGAIQKAIDGAAGNEAGIR